MANRKKIRFPVGGTSALYDADGRMVERGSADDVVDLVVPTVDEMAPIRERLAVSLDMDAYRHNGEVRMKSPTALSSAFEDIKAVLYSGLDDEELIWFNASLTDEQFSRLDDIAMRMLNLRALLKAMAEDVTAGN